MKKKRRTQKKLFIIFFLLLIIGFGIYFFIKSKIEFKKDNLVFEYGKEISLNVIEKIEKETTSDKNSNELYYVKGILVVNKKHPLPTDYAPGEDTTAGTAIRSLISDMQKEGLNISNSYSGYRSYSYQTTLYHNYVSKDGKEKADTYSARPGYSEHQTGLAFDLKHNDSSLITNSAETTWVAKNAHKYGFIVRYLRGKENITGYMAEPWHLRYIGDKATAIYHSGKTLEEYLNVSGGDYN